MGIINLTVDDKLLRRVAWLVGWAIAANAQIPDVKMPLPPTRWAELAMRSYDEEFSDANNKGEGDA